MGPAAKPRRAHGAPAGLDAATRALRPLRPPSELWRPRGQGPPRAAGTPMFRGSARCLRKFHWAVTRDSKYMIVDKQ